MVVFMFTSCEKNSTEITVNVPEVTTADVSEITDTTAQCGGTITSDGGATVTARGVCWSKYQTPTIYDNKTSDGTGESSFTSYITGLTASTTYYVRAYATNSAGTGYGSAMSFTTEEAPNVPELVTADVSEITDTAAQCGGTITSDGGATVTAHGVCWSTNQNPTVANDTTNDGTGAGSFTSYITGLTASTTYYVRAYATNIAGTGYGSAMSFTTEEAPTGTVTDVDGNTYQTVKIGDQWWMVENLKVTHYRNGDVIPNETSSTTWSNLTTGAYCNYGNNTNNVDTYGQLYNWYAVNDSRDIAPEGWHVPSENEWQTLVDYLGGTSVAGGKMKEAGTTHWNNPNSGASNVSGFSALPGGFRYLAGNYDYIGSNAYFWSSTESISYTAWSRGLSYGNTTVYRGNYYKRYGMSVRCVRDQTIRQRAERAGRPVSSLGNP